MEQEWIQEILGQLSPNFTEYAQGIMKTRVEPAVQKAIKDSKGGEDGEEEGSGGGSTLFKVEEFQLGSIKPNISNFKVHKAEDEDSKAIIIDFDLEYQGDCSVQVKALGMPSGVRDLTVKSRARVALKPRMSRPPFFGGIQFCFLDDVAIDFDLDGLADICDWSPIRRKIRKAVVKDAGEAIVYPNKVFIPTSKGEDPMLTRCLDPKGVLALKVNSGSGLPKKGGLRSLVGQDKPDTYVKVKSGAEEKVTSVVKNSADPTWDEPQWFYFLMETAKGHRISLTAMDEDSMSRDDFMGKAWLEVSDVAKGSGPGEEQEITLTLGDCPMENPEGKEDVSGDISVTSKWMPLVSTQDGASLAVVTVFIYSCNTLVSSQAEDGTPETTSVLVTLTGQETKRTEEEKNTQHPTFEEGFTFVVHDLETLGDSAINLEVLEGESTFGSVQLQLSELMESPIKKKLEKIRPDHEGCMATMTLSAKIEFA